MKYILKTLDDLRDDNDKLTALTLWYVYHGISRFYTSRTFLSLEIYRKLKGMYSLNELKESYDNEEISIYFNTQTNKIAKIENEYGIIYTPKLVNWYDKLVDVDHTYLEGEFETIYRVKDKKPLQTYYEKGDERYIILDGIITEIKKKPYQMKNYELNNYYESISINSVNPHHYAVTHNLMLDRGLIVGERLKLDDAHEAVEIF